MRKHSCIAALTCTATMALGTLPAMGQSFNVDVGTSISSGAGFGAPSNALGAAPPQAGFWNNLNGATATMITLNNLAGAATSVTLTRTTAAGGDFASNNANTAGDDEKLLDDGQDLSASTGFVGYTFANLAAGNYNVYTYAVAPDVGAGQDQTAVRVNGANQQIVTGPIPAGNNYALGISYALHSSIAVAAGGSILVEADGINGGFGTLNGIQLVVVNSCQVPLPFCKGDVFPVGGNGVVNIDDLLTVINTWGQVGPPRPQGDCAPGSLGDCLVNIDDLLRVIGDWGTCPVPTSACCFSNGSCQSLTQANCAAQGGTYQLPDGTLCSQVTCPIVAANDECTGALTVGNGPNNITNANSTDSAQPAPSCQANFHHDTWYKYTATCTGHLTVNTCATTGAVTDTVIIAYGGTCANLGAELACSDDSVLCTAGLMSSMTFDVVSGNMYLIRVGTFATTPQGAIVLTITCALANNDNCADATALAIPSTTNASILGATQDTAPVCNGVSAGIGRWYTVIGNGNTLTARTCNSPLESWDGRLSVYCGADCATLNCVVASGTFDCDSSGTQGSGLQETVSWCSANAQKYWILVHTDALPLSPEGNYTLQILNGAVCGNPLPCGPVAPANDHCAAAQDLGTPTPTSTAVSGTNVNATPAQHDGNAAVRDPELPVGSPSCQWAAVPNDAHNTVWYKFTGPAGGSVTIETCGSAAPFNDSTLGLYSGTCGNLTQIGCGEDDCPTPNAPPYYSRIISGGLTPGQVYYICVMNPGSWTGSVPGPFSLLVVAGAPMGACCVNGACIGTMTQAACTANCGAAWVSGGACTAATCTGTGTSGLACPNAVSGNGAANGVNGIQPNIATYGGWSANFGLLGGISVCTAANVANFRFEFIDTSTPTGGVGPYTSITVKIYPFPPSGNLADLSPTAPPAPLLNKTFTQGVDATHTLTGQVFFGGDVERWQCTLAPTLALPAGKYALYVTMGSQPPTGGYFLATGNATGLVPDRFSQWGVSRGGTPGVAVPWAAGTQDNSVCVGQ